MPQNMKLNDQDRAALREMEVVITRAADDRLQLLVKFPGGEELDVQLSRGRLLQELNIKTGDS